MALLKSGTVIVFSLTLILAISIYVLLFLSKTRTFKIRKHPAIDAIGEAISRAVELGRPVVMPAQGSLYSTKYAADVAAGLAVAGYITKNFVAPMKARLIVICNAPDQLPVLEKIVQQGLEAGGAPELYVPQDTIRFISGGQMAYAAAYAGIIHREKAASALLITMFAGEVSFMAEEGARAGCFQVAGSTNVYQIPRLIPMVDYMLVGEDMMAATAWITDAPRQVTTIIANDILKLIGLAATWIGAISVTLGYTAFRTLWGGL